MKQKAGNQLLESNELAALAAQAKAGDQAAFTELYDRTAPELYRCIRAMTRDEDLAWDIQQDAYLHAYQHLDQLENNAVFFPWLRRIAVNATVSQLRKRIPIPFTELTSEEYEELPELPDLNTDTQPELSLDRKESARLVREILSSLPESQQLIVGMRYYDEFNVKEIAEALHISTGTVKAQLFNGRKKIECAVRNLERQGIKLYGMSPMAFLLALLRNQEPTKKAGKKVAQAVLAKAVEAEPVVLTAKAVGSGFFHTTLGKLAAGVLVIAVAAGGVMGYHALRSRLQPPVGDYRPTESTSTINQVLPSSVESSEDETELLPIISTQDASTEDTTVSEPTAPETTSALSLDVSPLPGQTDPAQPDAPVFVEHEALRKWLIDEEGRLSSLQSTGYADYLRASLRTSADTEADGQTLVTAELWKTVLFSQEDYESWMAGGTLDLDPAAGYSIAARAGTYEFRNDPSGIGSVGYGYFTAQDSETPLTVHRVLDKYLVSFDVGGGWPMREYVGSYCFYLPNATKCFHADQTWEGTLQEYLAMHRGEVSYDAAEDSICLRSDGK